MKRGLDLTDRITETIVTLNGRRRQLKAASVAGLCLRLERGRPEGGAARALPSQFASTAEVRRTEANGREGPKSDIARADRVIAAPPYRPHSGKRSEGMKYGMGYGRQTRTGGGSTWRVGPRKIIVLDRRHFLPGSRTAERGPSGPPASRVASKAFNH